MPYCNKSSRVLRGIFATWPQNEIPKALRAFQIVSDQGKFLLQRKGVVLLGLWRDWAGDLGGLPAAQTRPTENNPPATATLEGEMRKMKGLLLGGAAALATAASAQAADLPVKAAPVEYVKICSLYGAGFFYIPGTDTCLKIGGYLRSDHIYGMANAGGYYMSSPAAQETRLSGDMYSFRARMNLTLDFRTQSDYGTIRAYAAIIAQQSSGDFGPTGTTAATDRQVSCVPSFSSRASPSVTPFRTMTS